MGTDLLRRLAALETLWNERRSGRPYPSRADFSWADLRPWVGHLEMVDVHPDGTLEVRLWGLSVIDYFGRDPTRRGLDACLSPSDRAWFERPYRAALAAGAPVSVATVLPAGFGTASPIERLILPLSRDGARIDMLLGAAFARERAPRLAAAAPAPVAMHVPGHEKAPPARRRGLFARAGRAPRPSAAHEL